MSTVEQLIADRLRQVIPNNYKEDEFILQLKSWKDRPMTEQGRNYMLRLMYKYRQSIPDHQELKERHLTERLGEL